MNFKNPERQLARWLEVLDSHTFDIQHRPGKKHGNADALSRVPCSQYGQFEPNDVEQTSQDDLDAGAYVHNGLMREADCNDLDSGPEISAQTDSAMVELTEEERHHIAHPQDVSGVVLGLEKEVKVDLDLKVGRNSILETISCKMETFPK